MEHDLNILMIFGIKEKLIILTIQCIVVYCYKYTCVTYDCFCAPETHVLILIRAPEVIKSKAASVFLSFVDSLTVRTQN